jgi:hypothetical protein
MTGKFVEAQLRGPTVQPGGPFGETFILSCGVAEKKAIKT